MTMAFDRVTMNALQGQFDFEAPRTDQGYARWLAGRQVAASELALQLGLPLGHEVEVWLTGGVRLRGRLRVRSEPLLIEEEKVRHLPLRVGLTEFTYREVESCVRLD